MRNRLQYLYSIFVFSGVFFTAYLMIEQNYVSMTPARSQTHLSYRSEAALADSGLGQLFQLEHQFQELGDSQTIKQKRVLSESQKEKNKLLGIKK
jgi:hypothetical protein